MRDITILYNSNGYLEIIHNDNASEKRVLEVLRKSVKRQEKRIGIAKLLRNRGEKMHQQDNP